MPRKLTIGKTSKISIFQRKTGRWIVNWYDEHGKRRNPSFATLKEAEAFQKQKRAELERHRETRFDLDDREMFSLARDLASSHGYTVLQAIQEWHSSKGSSKAMPLGEVIEKFLAAKSNRSAAYMDKLNADMRLFQAHFGADRSIDRIRSDEIEDFLDSKKAAVTAADQSALRNNHSVQVRPDPASRTPSGSKNRGRTGAKGPNEAQTRRNIQSEEFETFLGVVRPEWLPWLALGGLAGIRTDGEIFRITWECFKWDRRIIDLSTTMTKINERRHVPLCDRLIDLLRPVRRESGPVIDLKKPEDETARLQRVTGIRWRRNALRHSFCSYRVAITGDIPLVSIESGNSVQMIKRCYWDVKHFDEGLRWFGLTLPIPVKRRQEPFLMPLTSFGSA